MTEENTEFESRVKKNTSQEISGEDLQAGGFVFQLPEGTDDNERQAFEKTIEDAKKSGQNLTLSHEVKVIDTKAKPKGEPNVVEVGEKKKEAEAEDASTESSESKEEDTTEQASAEQSQQPAQGQQQPAQQQPQQQQSFVRPRNDVQYTQNQPWQYDPFTGAPIRPQQPQQPQGQPQAQPQQQAPQQQQYNPQLQGQPRYNPQPVYQQPPQNQQTQQQNNNQ